MTRTNSDVLSSDSRRTESRNRAAVLRVIDMIYESYQEPLALQDLAAEACYSAFHFTRVFHREAGVPPGQFLTSVRLYHAKRLLANSDMSIVDVVTSVGYSSVGTFTTRFTNATGVSPSAFRDPNVSKLLTLVGPCGLQIPSAAAVAAAECSSRRHEKYTGAIVGSIELPPSSTSTELLVGVFDSATPQAGPVACQTITASDQIELYIQNVPVGQWHIIAIGKRRGVPPEAGAALLASSRTAIRVSNGEIAGAPSLVLAPPSRLMPPIATLFGPPPRTRTSGNRAGAGENAVGAGARAGHQPSS